jgi:hypothetical protein
VHLCASISEGVKGKKVRNDAQGKCAKILKAKCAKMLKAKCAKMLKEKGAKIRVRKGCPSTPTCDLKERHERIRSRCALSASRYSA